MKRATYDVVIEAVHCDKFGEIVMARLYESRGAAFSDRMLVKRADLLVSLKKGKRVVTGVRRGYRGSTFEIGARVIVQKNNQEIIITEGQSAGHDLLAGVPHF